jgi:hypothetical protein
MLSVCGSGGGLMRGRDVVLLPLGGSDGGDLLPVDVGEVGVADRHGR